MELSLEGIFSYIAEYVRSVPAEIAHGDIFALTITLIVFFIAVVIINRLTGLLIAALKKIILFVIVTLAFWQFITLFFARLSVEGLTGDMILFGAAGIIIGFVAVFISLFVAFRSVHLAGQQDRAGTAAVEEPWGTPAGHAAPGYQGERSETPRPEGSLSSPLVSLPEATAGPADASGRDTLSISSLKTDKSLGAVLAYLVIAQFGVFSSKTIPAPTFQTGVAFFALFILAGLVFIHFTYHNYMTGIRHLVMAILIGTIMAVILGYFWADIPIDQLLSLDFFRTDALVALVTGLAISLFMGGKG